MAASALVGALACGKDPIGHGGGGAGGHGGAGGAGGSGPDGITTLPEGWNKIEPGGETRCGNGSPWAFYVRKGTQNRVVVELQGGGGCWDAQTCFAQGAAVSYLRMEPDLADEASNTGIHDHKDARNPVAGWHHVFVSYCTGDLHWGNTDADYGGTTFYHRGATNVRAVLEWLRQNVKAPDEVLVTGHSAGSYGSIVWAPWVAQQYPKAQVVQLGDSGAGVFPAVVFAVIRNRWNIDPSIPTFIPGTDPAALTELSDVYHLVARGFPDMRLAQVSAAFDLDQTNRWKDVGGEGGRAFTSELRANLAKLADLPHFSSYIESGSMHTIENKSETYSVDAGGVPFTRWLDGLVNGEMPASVDCAPDCGGPLIGDLGAPEEWACLSPGFQPPAPVAANIDLSLRFIGSPFGIADIDGVGKLSGLHVKACRASDTPCTAPLAEADTTTVGEVRFSLPTGAAGFDGFFRVTGPSVVPTRVYFWPPITSGDAWPMNGHGVSIDSPAILSTLLGKVGATVDPQKGQVRVSMFDCSRSYTAKAVPDLDGAVAASFYSQPPDWMSAVRAPRAQFINVDPGAHTLHSVVDATMKVESTLPIFVEAGASTEVIGLAPRP